MEEARAAGEEGVEEAAMVVKASPSQLLLLLLLPPSELLQALVVVEGQEVVEVVEVVEVMEVVEVVEGEEATLTCLKPTARSSSSSWNERRWRLATGSRTDGICSVSGYRFSPSLQLAMITACTGIAAEAPAGERAWACTDRQTSSRRQTRTSTSLLID